MRLINRLKQLAAAGIALTSFAEASNNAPETSNDAIENIPTTVQSFTTMDAKTAAGKLYQHFREEEKRTPKLDDHNRATIACEFIKNNNISDKDVYDMTSNYAKYVSEYMHDTQKKKADKGGVIKDIAAMYSAFMQTDFYETERDKIIKRWMPMAENISEGYYRYGYKCTAGYPTIGIGTCLTTSGLSLDDIPIRGILKDQKGNYVYKDGEPIPGDELTITEKRDFVRSLNALSSSSYSDGRRLTEGMGIYGLTLEDARDVATLEAQKKMDEILKFAFLTKNVDMFKEPQTLGVLALDIQYQCGSLTSSAEWPNFWRCICNRKYGDLCNHITVNGGQNKNRHAVKLALAEHIAADYTAKHEKNPKKRNKAWNARTLAYEKIRGYGIDIYGLKQRGNGPSFYPTGIGMAKAVSAKTCNLKKHEITPEKKAEFEKIKQMIREHNSATQQPVLSSSGIEGPYIRISGKKLRELQKKSRSLPQEKRLKGLSSQELTELARQNNINSKNLIHLTRNGGVDINVCIDYLKEETQKINRAAMQRKRSQGR